MGYQQGNTEQILANTLTNKTLGVRVSMIQANRRAFDKRMTDAILEEAAKRLTWTDNYTKHEDPS